MKGTLNNISIKGIASAVPENTFDNIKYAEGLSDRRKKKQVKLTGIFERRVCRDGQTASDLATVAAEALLEKVKWNKDEISVMIYVTQSSDIQRPSTAFIIQSRLGLPKESMVFDINQGCAGYIIGLIALSGMLQLTKGKGLLLVGESNAKEGDELTGNQLLDGAAASATAVEYSDNENDVIPYLAYCDGSRSPLLFTNHKGYGFMDGNAILLFGLTDVANALKKFMSDNNISEDMVDFYAFHQAQQMIVDGVSREAGVSEDKVMYSCGEFGNTSSASVPLTLCKEKENKNLENEAKVILCGYGIGLTWAMLYVNLDFSKVYPIIETSYVYDDRKNYNL